ncbi:hypothetical protein Vau01_101770 [Virgisporangium aurantiacum]|uniref:Uncharacterized protein n=1 Tax=Virgisporangium aurantiacum TaxID=175570 RepID=A0A8J3ZJH4_9ACTN|nr:hypothetical protein Vau01_101770 [Virgisporangium aurantiacum]
MAATVMVATAAAAVAAIPVTISELTAGRVGFRTVVMVPSGGKPTGSVPVSCQGDEENRPDTTNPVEVSFGIAPLALSVVDRLVDGGPEVVPHR